MLRTVLLVVLVASFGLYDLRYKKVDNTAVLVAAVICFVLASVTEGVSFALAGMGAGFLATFVMYMMGAIGAGDVKLFAAIGTLAGAKLIIRILVFSILVAGVIGVFLIVASLVKKHNIANALNQSAPFIPQCFLGLVISLIA